MTLRSCDIHRHQIDTIDNRHPEAEDFDMSMDTRWEIESGPQNQSTKLFGRHKKKI
jgi:hypothetical protein